METTAIYDTTLPELFGPFPGANHLKRLFIMIFHIHRIQIWGFPAPLDKAM